MATLKQIEANRLNAAKSTGPRTDSGKEVSRRNALKTGIFSEAEVLPAEDPAQLAALTREYHDHYRPADPVERELVDALVHYAWALRRFRRLEPSLVALQLEQIARGSHIAPVAQAYQRGEGVISRLQSRINAMHRNFRQALQDLEARQAARRAAGIADPAPCPEPVPESLPEPAPQPGAGQLGSAACKTNPIFPFPQPRPRPIVQSESLQRIL